MVNFTNPKFGQQAVTTGAVALLSAPVGSGLIVKARTTNAGKVFIGDSTVNATDTGAGTGFALAPGEAITLNVANANQVYIIGTASDVVYFACL